MSIQSRVLQPETAARGKFLHIQWGFLSGQGSPLEAEVKRRILLGSWRAAVSPGFLTGALSSPWADAPLATCKSSTWAHTPRARLAEGGPGGEDRNGCSPGQVSSPEALWLWPALPTPIFYHCFYGSAYHDTLRAVWGGVLNFLLNSIYVHFILINLLE